MVIFLVTMLKISHGIICINLGKSTEMNYILMLLLAELGNAGWPSTVLFRLPGKNVVEFSLEASSRRRIVCELKDTKTFSAVVSCSDAFEGQDAVMLIELEEDEMDPMRYTALPHSAFITKRCY